MCTTKLIHLGGYENKLSLETHFIVNIGDHAMVTLTHDK